MDRSVKCSVIKPEEFKESPKVSVRPLIAGDFAGTKRHLTLHFQLTVAGIKQRIQRWHV